MEQEILLKNIKLENGNIVDFVFQLKKCLASEHYYVQINYSSEWYGVGSYKNAYKYINRVINRIQKNNNCFKSDFIYEKNWNPLFFILFIFILGILIGYLI
jgi:hypothetical protein